ncbi:hypothetical protein RhiirC2_379270 [Rhizophagus irregularis]|uniref:Uncharacterized protein n=1 Tax=Rhizophagus irregularis TaxID=588596 RepID=A0A2N1NF04_9GLOM|nr:hypothetical protein RhiirC2_379270 [Rhizophagus irregularis]
MFMLIRYITYSMICYYTVVPPFYLIFKKFTKLKSLLNIVKISSFFCLVAIC